jgi:hypothetical protein
MLSKNVPSSLNFLVISLAVETLISNVLAAFAIEILD